MKHQCEAIAKAGTQCKKFTKPGASFCAAHSSSRPAEALAGVSSERTARASAGDGSARPAEALAGISSERPAEAPAGVSSIQTMEAPAGVSSVQTTETPAGVSSVQTTSPPGGPSSTETRKEVPECAICLEPVQPDKQCQRAMERDCGMACGHKFHKACIMKLTVNAECPTCRGPLKCSKLTKLQQQSIFDRVNKNKQKRTVTDDRSSVALAQQLHQEELRRQHREQQFAYRLNHGNLFQVLLEDDFALERLIALMNQ